MARCALMTGAAFASVDVVVAEFGARAQAQHDDEGGHREADDDGGEHERLRQRVGELASAAAAADHRRLAVTSRPVANRNRFTA
jgi:hypothetical protein